LTVLWTAAGTTVLLAGLLAYLMAAAVTRTIRRLQKATELLAGGDLTTPTEEDEGAPELRALAGPSTARRTGSNTRSSNRGALPVTHPISSARR
jgi:HAMP domain-containing protein